MKCLYALEQKQLLRVLKIDNTYNNDDDVGEQPQEEDTPVSFLLNKKRS